MASVSPSLSEECVTLFRNGVERILSNWTALKLAVDHGTGGPRSRELAADLVQYVGDIFCGGGKVEAEDISDVLMEVMDTQFNTWCEDNSPDEIAALLCKLYSLCSQGNINELRKEVDNLPTSSANKSQEIPSVQCLASQSVEMESTLRTVSEDTIDDQEMENDQESQPEEDPGWTRVSRRKKQVS